jgi:hypothetical protein
MKKILFLMLVLVGCSTMPTETKPVLIDSPTEFGRQFANLC